MVSFRYALVLLITYLAGALGATLAAYGVNYVVFERFDADRMTIVVVGVSLSAVLGLGVLLLIPRFRYRFKRRRIGFAVALSAAIMLIAFIVASPVFPPGFGFWSLAGMWAALTLIFAIPFLVGWILAVLIISAPPDIPGPKDVAAFE